MYWVYLSVPDVTLISNILATASLSIKPWEAVPKSTNDCPCPSLPWSTPFHGLYKGRTTTFWHAPGVLDIQMFKPEKNNNKYVLNTKRTHRLVDFQFLLYFNRFYFSTLILQFIILLMLNI